MRVDCRRLLACLLTLVAGCRHTQPVVMPTQDQPRPRLVWDRSPLHRSCLSASVDHIQVALPAMPVPPTVSAPESDQIWEMSLAEALAIALKNAEVVRVIGPSGQVTAAGFPLSSELPAGDTVYDPALQESRIEAALAAFDTALEVSMFWEQQDKPLGATFQGVFPRPGQIDTANFIASLTKPLATGGQARISFDTSYLFVGPFETPFGLLRSPAEYEPHLELSLAQPLLRGAGTDLNRAPIVIARLRSDQTLWDFKGSMLELARSVEMAYWELYAAHVALRAIEEVLPLAGEVVRIQKSRVELERAIRADLAQAETQFAQFRQQRIAALNTVLEKEATLRNLLGLPPADGRRIVPVDKPLRAPFQVDWSSTVTTAMENRPDIVRQRLLVRVRELELLVARNQTLPRLDVQALWRINGFDNELDDAIGLLTDNRFTDWSIGISLQYPLGNRAAAADLNAAELQLRRERALLQQQAHQASHRLNQVVQRIDAVYEQYQAARQRLQASRRWLDGSRTRFQNPPPAAGGQDALLQALDVYLRALQAWSQAATETSSLLAQYNILLAQLEQEKGTLLDVDNIVLQEDPTAHLRFRPRILDTSGTGHVTPPVSPDGHRAMADVGQPPEPEQTGTDAGQQPPAPVQGQPSSQAALILPQPADAGWRPAHTEP